MADLTFSDDDPIRAPALNAIARHEGIWPTVAATTTSASSAAVAISASQILTFEKRFTDTALRIDMVTALTSSAASTLAQIGVIFSSDHISTNWAVGRIYFVTGFDVPEPVSGVRVLSNVPAGTLAVTPFFRRISGAGTLTSTAGYPLSVAIREVAG